MVPISSPPARLSAVAGGLGTCGSDHHQCRHRVKLNPVEIFNFGAFRQSSNSTVLERR